MPELPEVETIARGLRHLAGRRLNALEIHDSRVWFESEAGPEGLAGLALREVSRRGKYLLLRFEGGLTLVQHLRMTGKMLAAGSALVPAAVAAALGSRAGKGLQLRCVFRFEGAELWFFDPRRFGTLTLTQDEPAFFRAKRLAPDPLESPLLAYAWFTERLARTGKAVKAALLDQSVVAGVGNIYADEALFRAGIHPLKSGSRIHNPRALWAHVVAVLTESIQQGGSTIRDYASAEGKAGTFARAHAVYGRAGQACPVCGTAVAKRIVAGRTTHFCPRCQPVYRPRRGKSARPAGRRSK